ncbi:MAG: P-II family nitrogen regulator [Thaumarchaeota archaeon]|nr:MAG: P-II family nitrogen regulator [Nitrososphaerota archaeon]
MQWKGQPVVHDLIAKSKLEVIVPDSQVNVVVNAIAKNARTGSHGDGIVFVLPIEQLLSIFTMDKDE